MSFNLLDRYIFKKFLSTFLFTLLIILMISVIIDFSEKIQIFLEEPITRREILLEYFPSFMLFISGMLWPLFTLIAVIFFTSRLAGNSEIMAMLSAGIPFNRLLRPYLYAAGLLTLIHWVGGHFILTLIKTKIRVKQETFTYLLPHKQKCISDITENRTVPRAISELNNTKDNN
ncbi:MAG: hypothetical protein RL086_1044 [Bacteroidota bacterium]